MRVEDNAMFRVKAVAELLDVSRSTVYRAIAAGELDALKIGAGKGAVRIPGTALNVWLDTCAERGYADFVEGGQSPEAADDAGNGDAVADGRACVVCSSNFLDTGVSHVPVGRSETGSQVFACVGRCEKAAPFVLRADASVEVA